MFSASPFRRTLELGREGWTVERLCGVGYKHLSSTGLLSHRSTAELASLFARYARLNRRGSKNSSVWDGPSYKHPSFTGLL